MNSCSTHELLRLALPAGSRLHTPEHDLKRHISHAMTLHALFQAVPLLQGGEFMLVVSGETLNDDEQLPFPSVITRLGEGAAGAIAYRGPIDDAATAIGVPLSHLPADTDLTSVERDVLYLLECRALQIERRRATVSSAHEPDCTRRRDRRGTRNGPASDRARGRFLRYCRRPSPPPQWASLSCLVYDQGNSKVVVRALCTV